MYPRTDSLLGKAEPAKSAQTLAIWKRSWDFETYAHLQVSDELINSPPIALAKAQLLELACALLNRAFEKEVSG